MANTKKESEDKTTTKKNSTKTASKSSSTKKASSSSKKVTTASKTKSVSSSKKNEPKVVKEEKVVKKEEIKKENKNTDISKKVILIVILLAFFILVFYLSTLSGKGEYSKTSTDENSSSTVDVGSESENITEDEMGELTSISIDEYLDLKESNEKYSIIYIGRPTCSHCQVQLPIMRYMVYKYGVTVNYLNTDTLDDDGISKLQSSDEYFNEGWGTPLILVVKGDKLVDMSEGETSIESLTEMFKKYNLISE